MRGMAWDCGSRVLRASRYVYGDQIYSRFQMLAVDTILIEDSHSVRGKYLSKLPYKRSVFEMSLLGAVCSC